MHMSPISTNTDAEPPLEVHPAVAWLLLGRLATSAGQLAAPEGSSLTSATTRLAAASCRTAQYSRSGSGIYYSPAKLPNSILQGAAMLHSKQGPRHGGAKLVQPQHCRQ